MGLGLTTHETLGTCGTFAAGAAAAKACDVAKAQGKDQVFLMGCVHPSCSAASCTPEHEMTVEGYIHSVEVPSGLLGFVMNNDPIVGIRAHSLPYVQAAGQRSSIKGNLLVCEFEDCPFKLPRVRYSDDLVIAFGTRTIFRVPFSQVENAPIDFNIHGEMSVPLKHLIGTSQPVQITVPIMNKRGALPCSVDVKLTLSNVTSGTSGMTNSSSEKNKGFMTSAERNCNKPYVKIDEDRLQKAEEGYLWTPTDKPSLVHENSTPALRKPYEEVLEFERRRGKLLRRELAMRRAIAEQDAKDIETEITHLEAQLQCMKKMT